MRRRVESKLNLESPVSMVETVFRDLQGRAPAKGLRLEIRPSDGDELVEIGLWEDGGGGTWITIPSGLPHPQEVVLTAEKLQDALAETRSAWGEARPPCPYHPHAAKPTLVEDVPWWICTLRQDPLFVIGDASKVSNANMKDGRRTASRRRGRKPAGGS
jgi:hypothetical protein